MSRRALSMLLDDTERIERSDDEYTTMLEHFTML